MFMSDAILGHIPLVIRTICRPRRDGEPCFVIMGSHHAYVGFHTRAYHPSYRDRLKWVGRYGHLLLSGYACCDNSGRCHPGVYFSTC